MILSNYADALRTSKREMAVATRGMYMFQSLWRILTSVFKLDLCFNCQENPNLR